MIEQTDPAKPTFGELAADAIRYWERRRIVYNLGLVAVVVGHAAAAWPHAKALITWNGIFGLFVLAVLANVAYCAACAVDLFVQSSGSPSALLRWRWVLLLIGTAFGCVLAHLFMLAVLGFR